MLFTGAVVRWPLSVRTHFLEVVAIGVSIDEVLTILRSSYFHIFTYIFAEDHVDLCVVSLWVITEQP